VKEHAGEARGQAVEDILNEIQVVKGVASPAHDPTVIEDRLTPGSPTQRLAVGTTPAPGESFRDRVPGSRNQGHGTMTDAEVTNPNAISSSIAGSVA
jgi:hypothetical protein